MTISKHLNVKNSRPAFLAGLCLLASMLSGCANVRVERASVEKLQAIHLVQVVTPALEVPTFMQAGMRSGVLGGAVPAAIVQGEAKVTLSAPLIFDVGALVTDRLKQKLPERAAWWPRMTRHEGAVPGNYVHPKDAWLRVEVFRYEIAPTPLKTLFVGVNVSLQNAQNRGAPLWTKQKIFSGVVHGGEKIAMENLPNDPVQLNREIERAADWIAKEITADIR